MGKTATTRQLQAASLFMAGGWMPSGASAMVGNLSQESGPSLPSAFRKSNLDHGSNGLPQWRLDRLDKYEVWVKQQHPELADDADALWAQYGRLDYQCQYIMIETKADYSYLDAKLRKGGSVSALVADICWQYERPSKAYANLANRINNGLLVFNSLPSGARSAHKTNIVAALDQQADKHDDQKNAGIATTAAAGVIGASTAMVHVAPSIHWYEWVIFGILVFAAICGVTAMFAHAQAAKVIRNAKPNVDLNAAPKGTPTSAATPTKVTAPEKVKNPKDAVAKAKADEQAAIDAAIQKTTQSKSATVDGKPEPNLDPEKDAAQQSVGLSMSIGNRS